MYELIFGEFNPDLTGLIFEYYNPYKAQHDICIKHLQKIHSYKTQYDNCVKHLQNIQTYNAVMRKLRSYVCYNRDRTKRRFLKYSILTRSEHT